MIVQEKEPLSPLEVLRSQSNQKSQKYVNTLITISCDTFLLYQIGFSEYV